MPALGKIIFTGLHADAYKPVYRGYGVWDIVCADNVAAASSQNTTSLSMQFSFNATSIGLIGNTYYLVVCGLDKIVGAPNCAVIAGLWELDITQTLSLNILNTSAGAETPTANNVIARIAILKKKEQKVVVSNPF